MSESVLIYGLYSSRKEDIRYIGQTKFSAKERLDNHLWTSKKKCTSSIHKWIRKEVEQGFDVKILPLCYGRRNIDEIFYISRAKELGWNLLNLSLGGDGGNTRQGQLHSEQTKQKMSLSSIGKNKGVIRDDNFKKNLSALMKAKSQTNEWKAHLSSIAKKPCSAETKRKISEAYQRRLAAKKESLNVS